MANTLLDHLRDLIDQASRGLPGVTPKRMFGCHALFANENIYALVWKDGRIGIKIPEAARFAELMALPGAEPWTAGRAAMSHWVLVPEGFHDDEEELRRWTKVAHGLASSGIGARPKHKARQANGRAGRTS
jgi:TfoX/Sxy family transcriptional regulator of competence genes